MAAVKPGDVLESAIWMTGEETPALRARYRRDVSEAVAAAETEHDVLCGPVMLLEKRPGEPRVPPVPDHIHGPDVRLLVAEAKVLSYRPHIVVPGSFVADLDRRDLERLRAITRRAHAKYHPGVPPLSDAECDRVIEELGPEAALDAVRRQVDSGTLH